MVETEQTDVEITLQTSIREVRFSNLGKVPAILRYFVVFLSYSRQCQDNTSIWP
jgi:hypothetical protein